MPHYLAQGGSSLYFVTSAGTATALTLPSGVTIDSTKRLRGAVVGNLVVLVGSPSENITVDRFGTVRRLCPRPPANALTLSAVAGGTLTGTYLVKSTYKVKDKYGNTLAESDFSPVSASQAVSTEWLKTTNIPLSAETISTRQLYRTVTGPGSAYFPWFELDGNVLTAAQDDLADASLRLIAAPTDLGTPPKFENAIIWKDRVWGYTSVDLDTLYQGAQSKPYAFPSTRTIIVPPQSFDDRGITGLLARKDELGVGKTSSFHKIAGTTHSNFTRSNVAETIGIWAQDSCVVIDDIGYFLGNPFGIYTWSPTGIQNISDAKVKAWFETDTYFNRARFSQTTAMYDPTTHSYILQLSAAGSSSLDRWIQYHIPTKTWWGPHKTDAFTPTGSATLRDSNDISIPVWLGSDGKLYKPQSTKTDGSASAIDFDVTLNFLNADSPSIPKFWDQPQIVSKVQSSGILTVTPTLGGQDASASLGIPHDMGLGTERLPRLGIGELCKIRLRQTINAEDAVVYGLELPFFELGRRG